MVRRSPCIQIVRHRSSRTAAFIALVVAATSGAAPVQPSALRTAKLEYGDGSVVLDSGSQSTPAKIGSLLQEGDALRIGVNSHVRLTFGDQAVIEGGPLTNLRILQLGQERSGITNLRIEQGQLRVVWADTHDSLARDFTVTDAAAVPIEWRLQKPVRAHVSPGPRDVDWDY